MERVTIRFHPTHLCDFVIHFLEADFHVHKFMLIRSSQFFADFLQDHSSNTKECLEDCHKSKVPTKSYKGQDCITFPSFDPFQVFTYHQFNMFLLQLYYPHKFWCCPYIPISFQHEVICFDDEQNLPFWTRYTLEGDNYKIDEIQDYTPLDLPHITSSREEIMQCIPKYLPLTQIINKDNDEYSVFDLGLMMLAHYFNCHSLLKRIEKNLMDMVKNSPSISFGFVIEVLAYSKFFRFISLEELCTTYKFSLAIMGEIHILIKELETSQNFLVLGMVKGLFP